ncbi:Splicing factor 3B subunit 6-like protein [Drosera capensis]
MYDMFGKFGAIRQIRVGTSKNTRGSAFVVYEDIYDHLTGFNVGSRKEEEKLKKLQEKYGVSTKADKDYYMSELVIFIHHIWVSASLDLLCLPSC